MSREYIRGFICKKIFSGDFQVMRIGKSCGRFVRRDSFGNDSAEHLIDDCLLRLYDGFGLVAGIFAYSIRLQKIISVEQLLPEKFDSLFGYFIGEADKRNNVFQMVEIGLLQIRICSRHILKRVVCLTGFVPFRQLFQYQLKIADSVGCRCDRGVAKIRGLNGRISRDGA